MFTLFCQCETPNRYRMFTPREVARIQSFPESFILPGSKTVLYRALGNAVPPVLMWEVTNSVIEAMTEDHNYEEKKLQPRFRTSKSSIKYYKPGVNN
ncbi:DNA cytosine methyltransferase [Crocosphaera watsonii WH 8501]|uniref:DNA cytosine methyltransferase n=1 Tax=Crocosphaera watsonii TaxID=263511 RepID=UPI0022840F3D